MNAQERERWQEYIHSRVKLDLDTGCWNWQLFCDSKGYGRASVAADYGLDIQAGRLAYTAFKGPIPEGRKLRQSCGNRPCCNPEHHHPIGVPDESLA
jgi:hypothetical protein